LFDSVDSLLAGLRDAAEPRQLRTARRNLAARRALRWLQPS
jgi:hypothetical protein